MKFSFINQSFMARSIREVAIEVLARAGLPDPQGPRI
jgi:hypothetical protein